MSAQEVKYPVSVTGNIQITQNGISPVPAFSLGRPALMNTARIRKGNFYFHTDLNMGLDLRPWTINMRPGYDVIRSEKFTMTLGANLSWFFKALPPNGTSEYEVQRYMLGELNMEYRVRENRKFMFVYWHTTRVDHYYTTYGQFTQLTYEMKRLPLGKSAFVTVKANTFYINNQVPFKGFFVSQISNFQRNNWKFNFSLQTVFPIQAEPNSGFLWNVGLNLPF